MNESKIEEAVGRILRDDLNLEIPSAEHDLVDSALLDSQALVELIFRLEENLAVQIDLETLELDDWRSVRAISRHLARSLEGAA